MLELVWLLIKTVLAWVRPRQDLVIENLLLRHQLAVLTRPTRSRPHARLRFWDKLLWVLTRRWCAGWRSHLTFVTPDTVVRWHRQGWRLFWRWKSRSRGGRPHLSAEVRELITTISRENRLWGTELIRRRIAQARHRGQQPLHPTLPLARTSALTEPDLAHVPAQPCPTICGRPM